MSTPQPAAPRRLDGSIVKPEGSRLQLPRKGKIHLGIRVKNSQPDNRCKHPPQDLCLYCSHPKEVPYFVCPPEFKAAYGDEPLELDIVFPFNEQNSILFQAYKWYSSTNAIKCQGNGSFAIRRFKDLTAEQKKEITEPHEEFDQMEVSCTCPMLNVKNGCRHVATLSFFVPKVSMAGVYQIDLKSAFAIANVEGGLTMARLATMGPKHPMGTVQGIPFKLIRKPRKMEWQGKMNTHYLVHLENQLTPEDVQKYRSGGVLIEHDEPAARIDAPQQVGALASSFTEEPGSPGAMEDVPESERVVNVMPVQVLKNLADGAPDDTAVFTMTAKITGATEDTTFTLKDRDMAVFVHKAIKAKQSLDLYFEEGSGEAVARMEIGDF